MDTIETAELRQQLNELREYIESSEFIDMIAQKLQDKLNSKY